MSLKELIYKILNVKENNYKKYSEIEKEQHCHMLLCTTDHLEFVQHFPL